MTDASARYLIAYNTEGKPLGYSHFRFDMDYGSPVLYWYETFLYQFLDIWLLFPW